MIRRASIRTLQRSHRYPRTSIFRARVSSHSEVHHDLPSFLTHARHTSLSLESTVFAGTYYEYLCASTLSRLSFTLTRVGGPHDAGIDLVGDWKLPALPFPLRVLVQCKAHRNKLSLPAAVRELEGATAGAPERWRGAGTVGVLCAKRPATKGAREAVRKSGMPVVFVMVEDIGEGRGRVGQMLWNQRVSEMGAEGVAVGLRHVVEEGKGMEREAVLLWKGRVWEPGQERWAGSTIGVKLVKTKRVKARAKDVEEESNQKSTTRTRKTEERSQKAQGMIADAAVSVSLPAAKRTKRPKDKAAVSTNKADKTIEKT